MTHSAEFGQAYLVRIDYNTDPDGRWIEPDAEEEAYTLHGTFDSLEDAQVWMDTYPDDTEVRDMTIVIVNRVQPRESDR